MDATLLPVAIIITCVLTHAYFTHYITCIALRITCIALHASLHACIIITRTLRTRAHEPVRLYRGASRTALAAAGRWVDRVG